jgi:hypothetical protein
MRWFRIGGLVLLGLLVAPLSQGRGTRLAGQVSPGPLAKPHAELEGTLKCTKCHGGGNEGMLARCISCHKDIGWLRERNRGHHGSRDTKGATCASCHPDHAGLDFSMVKWPEGSAERFDHRRAGWALEQRHAEIKCEECHTAKLQVSPAARQSARKTGTGWTGLETGCTDCHEDIHRGALGKSADCIACHDAGKWTVTPGFAHDTTGYALDGKHERVKCDKCHLAESLKPRRDGGGHLVPIYKPVPHQSCADCHADVHKGQFGPGCTDCHTTDGWKQIDRERFNHDKTKYPLRAKHTRVKCVDCHGNFSTPALKKPAFATCGACHKDAHNRTATLAGLVVDCEKCHAVAGFSPATYSVDQHRTSKYPLAGKHRGAKCATCHRKETAPAQVARWGTSRVVLRPAYARCLDCHADDHGGQLAAQPAKGECADCHKVDGWKPSSYDRVKHGQLKLGLEGRHAEVECRACHGTDRKSLPLIANAARLGKATFLFKVPEIECTACHVDPHKGRFAEGGARAKARGCLACHDTRVFHPSTADIEAHQDFGFALNGAHRATACVACHEDMKRSGTAAKPTLLRAGTAFGPLRFETKKACVDCHENTHGDQFASRRDKGGCDACHGEDGFQPASKFDHDRDATFKLRGGHEGVPCNRCHPTDTRSGDPRRLIFRPVSGKCETCHGKETR